MFTMWMTLNWGLWVDLKERMVRARLDQRNSRVFSWVSTHIFVSTKGTLASNAQEWDLQLKMVEVILGGDCGCGREWKMLGKYWKLNISQRELNALASDGNSWSSSLTWAHPDGHWGRENLLVGRGLDLCMEREWPEGRAILPHALHTVVWIWKEQH